MAMPLRHHRWTPRDVRALVRDAPDHSVRYELVHGELLVTPSPGGPHQGVVALLVAALDAYARAEEIGVALVSPSDVELEPGFLTQPDVYVLPVTEWRRFLREGNPARHALLVVEVLSPSSAQHDRITKRKLYVRHVREYWIVDPDTRTVERWRQGAEAADVLRDTIEWAPAGAAKSLTLNLIQLFRKSRGQL